MFYTKKVHICIPQEMLQTKNNMQIPVTKHTKFSLIKICFVFFSLNISMFITILIFYCYLFMCYIFLK